MKKSHAVIAALALLSACDRTDVASFDAQDFAAGDQGAEPQGGSEAEGEAEVGEVDVGGQGDATCEPTEARLLAGDRTNAGAVLIATTDEGLRIDLQTNGRWRLLGVHAFAGDVPPNDGATLEPDRFPFVAELDRAEVFALTIPFEQVQGGSCGETVVVSVQADVVQVRGDTIEQEEIAWVVGADGIEPGWGAELDVVVCCA